MTTKGQYIVGRLMTSANLSDSKAAIPLLKKVENQFPEHFTTAIFDVGYDYEPMYRQLHKYQMRAVIPYNVRNEGEYPWI
ncbi:transposase [Lysinibacillus sp. NPDC093190]|uniref:transposase n=1 Tax=Lysinibacillus sp. NPDC093190 TaxID=3390575 RepID=UPI003CFD26DB